MKIKTIKKDYTRVINLKREKHIKPIKPPFIMRALVRVLSIPDLWRVRFSYTGKLPKTAGLVLMNHSSFLDLKIASKIFFPRAYGIVCTTDALIGKKWLMRFIGCIPTRKFVSDYSLISDIKYMLTKNAHVLMYPEAGYSFDGTKTVLPKKFGLLLKRLDVPVYYIGTSGAFLHDPLYNGLRLRKVKVTASVKTLLTREQIKSMSVDQIDAVVNDAFSFDAFLEQQQNKIKISEPFRAIGLERILYKCPHCMAEGKTKGEGDTLVCNECGKKWQLTEYGKMEAADGNTEFEHIPDWFEWQRAEVLKEIESGSYCIKSKVKIGMIVNYKAFYEVGEGELTHTNNGFEITGCNGKLNYTQAAGATHTLNADWFWYEKGDVISIGDTDALYYCFVESGVSVAKARLATEELYKIAKQKKGK